jgi:hypothetical protein
VPRLVNIDRIKPRYSPSCRSHPRTIEKPTPALAGAFPMGDGFATFHPSPFRFLSELDLTVRQRPAPI